METKKIEIINYREVYVCADGTEFDSKEDARAYESSASGVLKSRLAKLALKRSSECDLFNGAGCDENMSFVVVPRTDADVTLIQQMVYMKSYSKEANADKVAIGKLLIVTISYDDDGLWVTDLGEIISNATEGKYEVVEKKGE